MTRKIDSRRYATVRSLDDLSEDSLGQFGEKAIGLVKARKLGANVLPGFVISKEMTKRIANSNRPEDYIKLLAPFVSKLLEQTNASSFIVRSSSAFESSGAATFSGIFDTYVNVKTTEQIVESVSKIYHNSRLPTIRSYFERFAIDFDSPHMAVLIQPYIDYDCGGVFSFSGEDIEIEFTTGSAKEAIAGRESYSILSLSGTAVNDKRILPRDSHIDVDLLASGILDIKKSLPLVADEKTFVEFLFRDRDLIVVQLKEFLGVALHGMKGDTARPPVMSNKTSAMEFFIEHDLFHRESRILKTGWSVFDVEESASQLLEKYENITIRLARGGEIGLPRSFCSSKDQAARFIRANAKKSHDIIMHGYIDVCRSIEILVSEDGFILEHVPGMWESPNKLQPDVITMTGGVQVIYRYLKPRMPDVDKNTKGAVRLDQPLTDHHIERLLEFGRHAWRTLSEFMPDQLPLNLHAVSDSLLEEFNSLNIRKGFVLSDAIIRATDILQVSSLADLTNWDVRQVVRLALTTSRGDERALVPIAEKLSKAQNPIIVDFGLLSHPAMVLREFGCVLVPSYLVPECLSKAEYEVIRSKQDFALEPVQRILEETGIIESPLYHVVEDRDPVSAPHFLCMAKDESMGAADRGGVEELERLYRVLSDSGRAFFYERGRAAVCTSPYTRPREHFHILQNINTLQTCAKLRELVGGQRFESLTDAYRATPVVGDYVVYGSDVGGYFMAAARNAPKGLLRTCVVS